MTRIISSILSVIIVVTIFSCVEKIDLEAPEGLSDSIVIQARAVLTEDSSYVKVRATRLFDFTGDSRQILNLKSVRIHDSDGNREELHEVSREEYFVCLNESGSLEFKKNKSYFIEVETFDNKIYRSNYEQIPTNTELEDYTISPLSIASTNRLGQTTFSNHLELKITTKIKDDNHGFLWEPTRTFKISDLTGNDCYVTENISVLQLPTAISSRLSSPELKNYSIIQFSMDSRIKDGTYINLNQYSLSKDAAKYWSNSQFLAERTGGFFDDPVGELPTNFTNINDEYDKVYGYFFTSELSTFHLKVPKDLYILSHDYCGSIVTVSGTGKCISACCDCSIAPNSTTTKPSYWSE